MYAVCNTLSRLRAHGTPHQSGNMPTLLLTRLASAPAWASACSLGAYLYLWVRGIGHALTLLGLHDNSLLAHALSEDSLRADVALLVALYGVESAAAFVLGRCPLRAVSLLRVRSLRVGFLFPRRVGPALSLGLRSRAPVCCRRAPAPVCWRAPAAEAGG